MRYIIISLILLLGVFIIISCKKDSSKSRKQSEETTIKPKVREAQENEFENLRNMAFSVTPEQLNLKVEPGTQKVYGVIMDWNMGGGIATTVSYSTGDASLYLSSGGGVIGGGQHENVNKAAKHFVEIAESYLHKAQKTEDKSLPKTNQIKFYILTNKGVLVGSENLENFENETSVWLKLFEEGNKVLSELRMSS